MTAANRSDSLSKTATPTPGRPVLVSACLLGIACRYDGGHCLQPGLAEAAARGLLVPICPEVAGGLATPRVPAEIQGGTAAAVLASRAAVRNREGQDVTPAFLAGAQAALALARRTGARTAILKQGSPSCGTRWVHNGTFQGQLVAGHGVTAWLLRSKGLEVYGEDDIALQLGRA